MVTGVILAGGKGTRLRPLTYLKPKPLVPVGNKPILEYILESFLRYKIDKILVLANYLGDQIVDFLTNLDFSNNVEIKVLNLNSLDTADAVRKARNEIEGDFIVSMGDIISNMDLSKLISFHEKKGGIATVALKEYENPLEYGVTLIDKNDRIVLFLEKPISYELYMISLAYNKSHLKFLYGNLVNTGVYVFCEEILDIISENKHLMDWGKHVFPFLLENGYEIYGWIMGEAYWKDVGNSSKYLQANIDVVSGVATPLKPKGLYIRGIWIGENIEIGENAKIVPPVALADNVTIGENAVIGPYTVMGEGCEVKREAIIRESVLWKNVIIGDGCKILSSIIADNVTIGANVLIQESTIGDSAFIDSGVTLKNIKIKPMFKILSEEIVKSASTRLIS
ncbi:MAG: NDP-sugar synthase [Thermoproteales archaeon]|nr:NDP-sugar synthase [Thermoproteales archaeon]